MGERSDEVRRDPLSGREPLGERGERDPLERLDPGPLGRERGFDPATDAFRPDAAIPPLDDEVGEFEVDEIEVDEVEVTRIEIERTRADMSETVDAIQERLNPENLKEQAKDRIQEVAVEVRDQAKDKVREATVGTAQDVGSGVVGIIRNNPVPAALAGAGLGWLLVNSRRQQPAVRRTPDYDAYGRYPSAYGVAYDSPSRYEEQEPEGSSAGRAVNRAQDKVGEAAGQVGEKAGEMASQAQARAEQVGQGARQTGSTIADTIRENPVPAVLAGLGLGWLLVSGRQQNQVNTHYRPSDYPSDYGSGASRGTEGSSAEGALSQAQSKVGETAGQAQEKVGEAAGQIQNKAGEISNRTQEGASRLAGGAQQQARRAGRGFQRTLQQSPLTVGALAVGVGAAVGLAVPETNKEHEVMGEARDTLVDKAQEKVQETQQKVQKVAEEAQSAAKSEAGNQGLTE